MSSDYKTLDSFVSFTGVIVLLESFTTCYGRTFFCASVDSPSGLFDHVFTFVSFADALKRFFNLVEEYRLC